MMEAYDVSRLNARGWTGRLFARRGAFRWPRAAAVVLSLVCFGAMWALAAKSPPRAKPTRKAPAAAQLVRTVGADTCKTCHEPIYDQFQITRHWNIKLAAVGSTAAVHGCETCHGGGAEHVEAGGDKSKIFTFKGEPATDTSRRCLTCHEYGQEHANFQRSAHLMNDVGCMDCHSPHFPKQKQYLLTQKQPQLCYDCHVEQKAEFAKPFRHRVNENLVKCSDCHNPHGGFLTRQLRSTAAQDAPCFKCHMEKSGPFVFEHAPVKTEGCVACHTPHGSSNPRLLKRSQLNLICLECHTLTVDSPVPGIPSFHNQAQKYQACTMCHVSIHGSNFSKVFFK